MKQRNLEYTETSHMNCKTSKIVLFHHPRYVINFTAEVCEWDILRSITDQIRTNPLTRN